MARKDSCHSAEWDDVVSCLPSRPGRGGLLARVSLPHTLPWGLWWALCSLLQLPEFISILEALVGRLNKVAAWWDLGG